MRTVLLLTIALVLGLQASADRTTRRRLVAPQRQEAPRQEFDTVAVSAAGVRISGYDKPLNATRETFLVTNNTTDTLRGLILDFVYTDMQRRTLHKRRAELFDLIPPGETRQVSVKSWDIQHSYYYHLGKTPRTRGVTPYDVTVFPVSYLKTSQWKQ